MRRLSILVGLIVFVVWLETGGFGAVATCSVRARGLDGETDPHWGCVDNQCVEVYACGVDDCSACPGCDPNEESWCLMNGGTWNSSNCTCELPQCDPYEEQQCVNDWGEWDPATCSCWNACNAGDPYIVRTEYYSETMYCHSCNYGAVNHVEVDYWEQRCQDGRLVDAWSIETGTVYDDQTSDCWYMCS